MSAVSQLNDLYDQYAKKLQACWIGTPSINKAFNFGVTPRNHPCHTEYFEELSRWVDTFLSSGPSYSELLSVTHWILKAAEAKDSPTGGPIWILYAAHGLAKPLIPLLQPEDRAELRDAYDNLYPRRGRLPVQKEVYQLLKK